MDVAKSFKRSIGDYERGFNGRFVLLSEQQVAFVPKQRLVASVGVRAAQLNIRGTRWLYTGKHHPAGW